MEGDYKNDWMAADTVRDPSYGYESYPFWPQALPGDATLQEQMVCGAGQRAQLEDALKNMTEDQKTVEFHIDLGVLLADTTDIIEHYATLKKQEARALAFGEPPPGAEYHGSQPH